MRGYNFSSVKQASPSINDVLERFVAAQDPPSEDPFASRSAIVDCIRSNLDMYGHTMLPPKQAEWVLERYGDDDEAGSLCNLLGPELILPSIEDFLGYFMVAKMLGPPQMTAAAGPVCIDLARWMGEQGLASDAEVDEAVAIAEAATTDIPAADAASALLHEHWGTVETEDRLDVVDWDGGALIARVEPDAIWIRQIDSHEQFGPIVVPSDAALLLQPEWVINAPVLVRTTSGWHIAESGFIYTDASRFL